jgi:hypothetical protein
MGVRRIHQTWGSQSIRVTVARRPNWSSSEVNGDKHPSACLRSKRSRVPVTRGPFWEISPRRYFGVAGFFPSTS